MTLSTMLADLYRRLNFQTAPAAAVTTRLTAFLNETLQDILAMPGIGEHLVGATTGPITFASVANTATYTFPPVVDRVTAVTERTNDWRLGMRTLDWYRRHEPDPTASTGTPSIWVPLGRGAVAQQPSNASQLFVDSTSAGDTGTATIEAIYGSGSYGSFANNMGGISAVIVGPATTMAVTKFYLSVAAVGTVTLVEDAEGGTVLATIVAGDTTTRYQGLALWPTPSSAITYQVDYERAALDLINANDEPPLPTKFHRLLVLGARMKEYEKMDDERYIAAKGEYEAGLKQLTYSVACPPDYLPVSGQGRLPAQRSRLGAQYPVDTW